MEESRYTLNGALLIAEAGFASPWWPPTAIAWPWRKPITSSRAYRTRRKPLVPKKAMAEIQRLASEAGENGQIEFARDDSHLFFRVGERLLISRMLTGQFPNYEAVLPRDNSKKIVLERGEFNDAVRRVSQLADQRSHAVKFSSANRRAWKSPRRVPNMAKPTRTSRRNTRASRSRSASTASTLLDFLAAAADGPISVELKDEQSAGQMRPAGGRDVPLPLRHHAHAHLIFPIRSAEYLARNSGQSYPPSTGDQNGGFVGAVSI